MGALFDNIVLLAHDFPFVTGYPTAESYLQGEITTLSQMANRVIVFAHEGFCEDWPLQEGLPHNVVAFGVKDEDFRVGARCLGGIRRRIQRLTFARELRSEKSKIDSTAKRDAAIAFLTLSDAKYRAIRTIMREEHLNIGGTRTLLYSFWFNEPARSIILLADALERETGSRPLCICRAHGYDCYDYRSDLGYLPFKKWMAERLDGVFVCSRNGAEYLREHNPSIAKEIKVAYLGTRAVSVSHDAFPCGEPMLASCSRAVPLKRVERIIDALAVLEARGYELSWTFIGCGETLEALREKAASLKKTKVIFTGGLSNEEVLEFYAKQPVDLFINVSEVEGVPLSIMEALSFGIPAIATDVGGNAEIVEDGFNGYLLEKDFSNEELADAIEQHLHLELAEANSMRKNARARWEERFQISKNARELLESLVS